jgi:hypothetical protein
MGDLIATAALEGDFAPRTRLTFSMYEGSLSMKRLAPDEGKSSRG